MLDYFATSHLDVTNGIRRSPQGLTFITEWGSLRHAMGATAVLASYARYLRPRHPERAAKIAEFAEQQVRCARAFDALAQLACAAWRSCRALTVQPLERTVFAIRAGLRTLAAVSSTGRAPHHPAARAPPHPLQGNLIGVHCAQVCYVLGGTGRSFVIGCGANFPRNPHHRDSALKLKDSGNWDLFNASATEYSNPNLLAGALVGGPGVDDGYEDLRSDYQVRFSASEVAVVVSLCRFVPCAHVLLLL